MPGDVSFPIRIKLDAAAVAGGTADLDDALGAALGRAMSSAKTSLGSRARVVTHAPTFGWLGPGVAALLDEVRAGVQGAVTQVVAGAAMQAGIPAPASGRARRKQRKRAWRILSSASVRCGLGDFLDFCTNVAPFAYDFPSLYFDYREDEIWASAWIVTVDRGMPVDELATAVEARYQKLSRHVAEKHQLVGRWAIGERARRQLIAIDRGHAAAGLAPMGSPYSVYVDRVTGREMVNRRGRVLFVMSLLPKLTWETTVRESGVVTTVRAPVRDLDGLVDATRFEKAHRVRWETYRAALGEAEVEVHLAPFVINQSWSYRSLILQASTAFPARTAGQTSFGGVFLLSEDAIRGLPESVKQAARAASIPAVLALPPGTQDGVWPAFSLGAMIWTVIPPDRHNRLIALYWQRGRADAEAAIAILESDHTFFIRSHRLGNLMRSQGSGESAARFAFMLDELQARDGGKWFDAFFRACAGADSVYQSHYTLVSVAAHHWYADHPQVVAARAALPERYRRASDHGYGVDEILIGKDAGKRIQPGDRLYTWNRAWAHEDTEYELTDRGMKRLENAFHEETLRFLKEDLFTDPYVTLDEDVIAARIAGAVFEKKKPGADDVRELEYLRTLVLHEVRPYQDAGLTRWRIVAYWVRARRGTSDWKFVRPTSTGGWKEVDAGEAEPVVMERAELDERMIHWEIAQGSKAIVLYSKIVAWGGLFAIGAEVGAVQFLVDLAGGRAVVGTSIALSELFYFISGETLTFEGFLITALIGYLSALTFRFVMPLVTPLARKLGNRISGASLLRAFAATLVERAIVGGAVGAATGLLTTLVLDLINGKVSSAWDYVRNALAGMLFGAVFECGGAALGALFRSQGLHTIETIANLAARLKDLKIRPSTLVADFQRSYLRFATWMREILDASGAEIAAATKTRFGELVTAVSGNLRASIFRRVLDLAEVTRLTPTQAHALERLLDAMEGHFTQQAGLDLANAMVRVQGRIGAYLDALAGLDDLALVGLAKDGHLLALVDAPATIAVLAATPRDALAVLRGSFRGTVAELESFLVQSAPMGAGPQTAALKFLHAVGKHVPPDLVLLALRSVSKLTPEMEAGLVRLVARAGLPLTRTALQGAPTANVEAFLGLFRHLSDDAVKAIAANLGALDALAKVPPRSLQAFADIAQGLPASTIEKAAASPAFVKAVEAAGEVVDKLGLAQARAMFGEKLGKKTHVPETWAGRLAGAPELVNPTPLQPGSWILDSQSSYALTAVATKTADSGHTAVAAELNRLGVTDIRVTATTVAEMPPIPGVTRGGVSLSVPRTDPEYQGVVATLRTRVGDAGDIAVAAEALFAAKDGSFNARLFTADRDFGRALANLAGVPPSSTTFTLTIGTRTITVVRYLP